MKRIAFVLYPGLTPLDLVGPLQVLSALEAMEPDYEVAVVAADRTSVESDTPLRLSPSHTFAEVPEPFAVVVPGGLVPTIKAMGEQHLLDYVRTAADRAEVVGSVCTGSLILGAAGLLRARRATTHWAFLDVLARFGATPVPHRWVEDGKVLTAAGVSAGIDMAVHLVSRLAGARVARKVQFGIEYDPEPPLGALNWDDAPRQEWKAVRDLAVREGLADSPELAALFGA